MQTIVVHGEPVTITEATFKATCQWYADNCQGCIAEAISGKVRVNNLDQYVKDQELRKQKWINCDSVESTVLYFWQKAYCIQTGKSVSIL